MRLDLAWTLSDTFNGLMMLPNLIGGIALSGTVVRITQNYLNRRDVYKRQVFLPTGVAAISGIRPNRQELLTTARAGVGSALNALFKTFSQVQMCIRDRDI